MSFVDDVLLYLEVIKDDYPTGLNLQAAALQKRSGCTASTTEQPVLQLEVNQPKKSDSLLAPLFVCVAEQATFSESPEGKLLQAAVEKGLKKSLSDIKVLIVSRTDNLISMLAGKESYLIVLLGQELWKPFQINARGLISRYDDFNIIPSLSLSLSLTDKDVKKMFWEDLKLVMRVLNW